MESRELSFNGEFINEKERAALEDYMANPEKLDILISNAMNQALHPQAIINIREDIKQDQVSIITLMRSKEKKKSILVKNALINGMKGFIVGSIVTGLFIISLL